VSLGSGEGGQGVFDEGAGVFSGVGHAGHGLTSGFGVDSRAVMSPVLVIGVW